MKFCPCFFSDHDSVDFSVELANVNNHGPCVWRLNLDLLKDEVFCSNIMIPVQISLRLFTNGGISLKNRLNQLLLILVGKNSEFCNMIT